MTKTALGTAKHYPTQSLYCPQLWHGYEVRKKCRKQCILRVNIIKAAVKKWVGLRERRLPNRQSEDFLKRGLIPSAGHYCQRLGRSLTIKTLIKWRIESLLWASSSWSARLEERAAKLCYNIHVKKGTGTAQKYSNQNFYESISRVLPHFKKSDEKGTKKGPKRRRGRTSSPVRELHTVIDRLLHQSHTHSYSKLTCSQSSKQIPSNCQAKKRNEDGKKESHSFKATIQIFRMWAQLAPLFSLPSIQPPHACSC